MIRTKFDQETKLWSGFDIPSLYNPEISIAQVILRALKVFGSKVAQINDNSGIQLTFDEIRSRTIRAAINLQKRGYGSKQVFGLIARNSDNVAPIVFASMCIGCPINALDPSFGKSELNHMLNITKPSVIFCEIEVYAILKECLKELGNHAKIFTIGNKDDSEMEAEAIENLFLKNENKNMDDFVPVRVDGMNETVAIVCSSGTTGLPKGVCLSHTAFLDGMTKSGMMCNDVFLNFSSLYWISGWSSLLVGTLVGATRIITNQAYSAELQLQLIERYRVTYIINATYQMVLMVKSDSFHKTDFSSLKFYRVGGSKIPLNVKNALNSSIPNVNIQVFYGMSEAASMITLEYPVCSEKNSVGQLLSGFDVKIINDEGKRCGINEDGEIHFKGTYKFLGYYGNQKATDEMFDNEGFIVSGDIGHFDEDGYLYITDRKKDILKYCNFPISPSEIDNFLLTSPDIEMACVVGIPDAVATDLPAAVIVRANGSNVSENEIYDMVADHFADCYKLRGGVYFIDSLPLTPSGKVIRRKVKEIAIQLFNARNI